MLVGWVDWDPFLGFEESKVIGKCSLTCSQAFEARVTWLEGVVI